MTDQEWHEDWYLPVKKVGMTTLLLAAVFSFLPLVYLYFAKGILPDFTTSIRAWGLVAASFGAFYVVEPVSYYAILGLAGTYLSFLTGNISNLRLPCSAMAQEVLEVEEGSRKAEIVGTLGITGSVITNLLGVTLAAMIGMYIIEILPEIVIHAFRNYTAPAIFGAVFGQFSMKYPRLAPVGITISIILIGVFSAPAWISILAAVFGSIFVGKILFNRGIID
jgi:hypothetical protein